MKKHLKILAIAALAFVRCGHKEVHNVNKAIEAHPQASEIHYIEKTGPSNRN